MLELERELAVFHAELLHAQIVGFVKRNRPGQKLSVVADAVIVVVGPRIVGAAAQKRVEIPLRLFDVGRRDLHGRSILWIGVALHLRAVERHLAGLDGRGDLQRIRHVDRSFLRDDNAVKRLADRAGLRCGRRGDRNRKDEVVAFRVRIRDLRLGHHRAVGALGSQFRRPEIAHRRVVVAPERASHHVGAVRQGRRGVKCKV